MNLSYEELQKKYESLQRLHSVSKVIHSSLDPQKALELIVTEAVGLMRASSGSLVLINPTTNFLEIEASIGLPEHACELKLRVGEGITGWVASSGKPARIPDVRQDPRYFMLGREIASELAVPLEVNGQVRGVINVDSVKKNAFTAEDQEMLESLAKEASKVIHNSWMYEQLRLKARLFETLISVSQTINSTLSLSEALQVITQEACLLMEAKMCSLLLRDGTGEWLDLQASFGAGEAYIRKPRLSLAESLLGIVVRRRKPLQIENVQISARYQNVEVARAEGLVSLLSVPLLFQQQAMGTLNIYTEEVHSFSNEEIKILSALAELSAATIEKARLYERIADVEDQLRQNEKLSALGLLAAEVAHEIRNPLTVMKMLYHSMDLQFPPEDPRSRDAQIMSDKMEHLNKIVEQILDFARNAEPKLAEVNVNILLEDLLLLTRHKLRNQNIILEKKLDTNLPQISADSTQLEQACLNLTLNAVEAMPEGGRLTIKTYQQTVGRKSTANTYVCIEFKDSGHGMSPEQRSRAFSSLLSTTKPKGTGLGLALVGKVVEAHRGKTKIRSTEGKGTTIVLLFPTKQ